MRDMILHENPHYWPLIHAGSPEVAEDGGPVSAKLRELHEVAPVDLDQFTGFIFGWRGLMELAERFDEKRWLFRGQTQHRPLLPAIGRPGARKTRAGEQSDHSSSEERRILELFKASSRPYLDHQPETDVEWLAVARHHGMVTRLLDWTESFLVAAMFACVNSGISSGEPKHPEVCALTGVPDFAGDPFELKEVVLYRPPHITARIPAQQGVFTVHPRPEEPLDHHPYLQRWMISTDACFQIKKKLDLCGINESTVFPDLDGLGRYQSWRYKWGI
jgi:hypothetical protein